MCQVQSIRQKDALNAQKTGMSKTVCFSFKPMQRSNEPSYVCFLLLLYIYYFLISGSEVRQVSETRPIYILSLSTPSKLQYSRNHQVLTTRLPQTHRDYPLLSLANTYSLILIGFHFDHPNIIHFYWQPQKFAYHNTLPYLYFL